MMKVSFRRPSGFNTEAKRKAKEIRVFVTSRLIAGLTDFQDSILHTPVYTGRTLINYRWSLGKPITETRAAIKDPALPGVTSDKAIGEEPRRGANAQIVTTEFVSMLGNLRANPFQKIFLNNNLAHFTEVEYGTYAKKDGQEARTPPGGMTRRGETAIEHHLEGLLRLVS